MKTRTSWLQDTEVTTVESVKQERPVNVFNTARRAVTRLGLVGLLAAVLAACSQNPLDTTRAESPVAEEINNLFWLVMIIAAVVFVLVQGALLYMARRFRAHGDPLDEEAVYGDDDFPHQTHGNFKLEITWTILPALLMGIIGVLTLGVLFSLDDVDASEPGDSVARIDVVGAQWWWEFHYYLNGNDTEHPDFVTANEIVIPVGEEIELQVSSRDVIHSWWIPRLNGKRDAVPGRQSPWTIEAVAPGRYQGQCTEFCGLSHAYMKMYAVAIPANEYMAWAENQMEEKVRPVEGEEGYEGWKIFEAQCQRCHVINGVTETHEQGVRDTVELYSLVDGRSARIIPDAANQVSGAAPNLTHLMARTTFAGSIFDLYENPDDLNYTDLPESALNRAALEAWILNAPDEKANAADQEGEARGMPSFAGALSGSDIDHLVDYLMTLD